jgi:photosystem II stability/assembly factor-like uncharacterized protein
MTAVRGLSLFFPLLMSALVLGCDSAGDAMTEPPPVTEEGWRRVSGVPASFMGTMLVTGDTLTVGGQGRVYQTTGTGRWTASAPVPDGYEIATLLRADGRLFAGTYRLYRSPDVGETGQPYDLNVGPIGRVRFARDGGPLVALAAKPTGLHLFTSGDDGRSWRRVADQPDVQAFDVAVYDDRLYVARADGLWSIPTDEILN